MKTIIFKILSVTLLVLLATGFSFAQKPLKVIILRHAEKPAEGDNLSCEGFNRAMKLPSVLIAKFGVPDYVYVPSPSTGKATKSGRMMQTIWPLAVKYNLTVNSKYDVEKTEQLAANILKRSGTVIVVWEHGNIPDIIDALGVKTDKLKWKGDDFDSLWIVTFKGKKSYLTTEAQGIKPSANCAF
ncbi:histidine phosphatase family protein [Mucilaginibacter sp. KACC 22063]|uniref:histidine phosphatase family protein n=1 Tax=Mucilaginibacter sp. KACC 22063 TaxID=3025666 RepID=UPI0023670280|nr:histidine phosphatase family protein [Mucilaginibacter sp. KACC 22063]WDF55649.1 histidine phosphatase family protein [Mucilaginibacter sp. KACC 22063]